MAKKSNVNINDLSTWTIPIVLVFSLIIIAVFLYLIKTFLVSDVTAEIESTDGQVSQQETLYAQHQETIATLPQIRKEVEQLKIVRNEAKKFLPTDISMPSLIDNVYLSARNNGIVFDSFTPEDDIDTEFYTIKPIALSTDVGFLSMSDFIEEVTTLKRIMNVHSVSFNSSSNNRSEEFDNNEDAPLTMTAQLRTYIFKDDETTE